MRGSIYDRNGLPLATSRPDEIAAARRQLRERGGVTPERRARPNAARCYPLGGLPFSCSATGPRQTNWAARNSSFLERDSDARLKGYDDHAQRRRRDQSAHRRARAGRSRATSRAAAARPAIGYRAGSDDVARVCARASATCGRRSTRGCRCGSPPHCATASRRAASRRGAAVVLDADTGEVLAAASYPWPAADDRAARTVDAGRRGRRDALLDRARYGLYPPGSTFKLLVAGAALRSTRGCSRDVRRACGCRTAASATTCAASSRPVRDDPMDTVPHGDVDLRARAHRVVQRLLRAARAGASGRGRCSTPRRCSRSASARLADAPPRCGGRCRTPATARARRWCRR